MRMSVCSSKRRMAASACRAHARRRASTRGVSAGRREQGVRTQARGDWVGEAGGWRCGGPAGGTGWWPTQMLAGDGRWGWAAAGVCAHLLGADAALEGKRRGHHADREAAGGARDVGDDRRRARAGAAAHARRDEDHVGVLDDGADLRARLEGARLAHVRLAARAEPTRRLADLDDGPGERLVERLCIGVARDVLDARLALDAQVEAGDAVERVAAAAAHADELDRARRQAFLRLLLQRLAHGHGWQVLRQREAHLQPSLERCALQVRHCAA